MSALSRTSYFQPKNFRPPQVEGADSRYRGKISRSPLFELSGMERQTSGRSPRDSPSPIPGQQPDDGHQGVSRSVLEWDPLAEEYRRRMEPVDATEESTQVGRKFSSAGFDDFSDRASRMSDAGLQNDEGSVHRAETTLVYDDAVSYTHLTLPTICSV